ncbi:MAG TPA: CHAT domain-containing protein [Paracoccaceae bacterium]|nr:CHAT domain-containing protein [Paracoccaceae bacterium]
MLVRLVLALSLICAPVAAQEGDPIADSFVMAQAGFASAAGNALRQIALRAAAREPALAGAVRDRQDGIEALGRAERAVRDALAAGDAVAAAQAGAEAAALRAGLAEVEARIAAGFPGFDALARPRPLTVEEVRARLAADEALVFVMTAPDTTFVWFLRAGFLSWHRVPVGREGMAALVRQVRRGLGDVGAPVRAAEPLAPVATTGLPEFPLGVAADLHALILGPLVSQMEGVAHLLVVADGPLTALPFHLLVGPGADVPAASADPEVLRRADWLVRRVAVTTLPSVESLGALRGGAAPRAAGAGLFALGDPVLGGPPVAGGLAPGGVVDVAALRALAPLPGTGREVRGIAATFAPGEARVLTGAGATETALRAEGAALRDAGVVVFATHGLVSGDLGLAEPALVLTPPDAATATDDGLLSASEIAALDLAAEWVVLSACNTAAGDGTPDAEGLSGLARAFLLAGARGMIVSHWPVRDDAAARLTTGAFRERAAGPVRKAEALRRSMVALMDDARDPTLAHPFAWAPFAMVGEGGP